MVKTIKPHIFSRLSAKAYDKSCEAGAVGAIIGEMVGDWLVTGELRQ
ncbi:hypothetical protein [Moraxella canis]|nr:hypothetical protein [Moraxella canis]